MASTTEASAPQKKSDSKDAPPRIGLGDRMKQYEWKTDHMHVVTNGDQYLVVRCDGHSFSKFTKGFKKPFDARIATAMVETTRDLMETFSSVMGFTVSDEITIVFPPTTDVCPDHVYRGRVQKIASSVAGYCSVRFAYHIANQNYDDDEKSPQLKNKVSRFQSYFDARVIAFPSVQEVANHFVWRSLYDGVRNSVSSVARHHLGQKKVFGKGGAEMKEMLRTMAEVTPHNKGIPVRWEDQLPQYKWGLYGKKELYETTGYNPKTKETVPTTRSRIVFKPLENMSAEEHYQNLIMAKYWPSESDSTVPQKNEQRL